MVGMHMGNEKMCQFVDLKGSGDFTAMKTRRLAQGPPNPFSGIEQIRRIIDHDGRGRAKTIGIRQRIATAQNDEEALHPGRCQITRRPWIIAIFITLEHTGPGGGCYTWRDCQTRYREKERSQKFKHGKFLYS
jgi:hypothetical protein